MKNLNDLNESKEPFNILFIANFPKEFREEDINTISMLVNNEINKRSKLFKDLSPLISNINEYNKKATEKLPRMLMIIDEVLHLFINYQSSKEVKLTDEKAIKVNVRKRNIKGTCNELDDL
ncbi:MAG: hypothetical protein LBG28_04080 [Tannerella sp.]|nr:hypothetical protein [Tannerella sp.]